MDKPVISINEDPYGFYTHYFKAIAASQANTAYCEQLFRRDMGQHGFAEISYLDTWRKFAASDPIYRHSIWVVGMDESPNTYPIPPERRSPASIGSRKPSNWLKTGLKTNWTGSHTW